MRAGLAEQSVGRDESRGERAEQLHLLAAHDIRMGAIPARYAGHDRGLGIDPEHPRRQRGEIGRRRDIGHVLPAHIRTDHARQQHRQSAEPCADRRHFRLETARRDRRRAAIVALGGADDSVLDQENAPVGGAPIDCEKVHRRHWANAPAIRTNRSIADRSARASRFMLDPRPPLPCPRHSPARRLGVRSTSATVPASPRRAPPPDHGSART